MVRRARENYWVSLSDIMTGLMIIFMFIAISYIHQVNTEQAKRDEVIKEYRDTKIELYEVLKNEFEDEFKKSNWNAELGEDLSIRFLNEDVLFDYNENELKPEFELILKDFFSRYLTILLDNKFVHNIAEVRIEGHTDSKGGYMYNVKLSQERTANVLQFLLYNNESLYRALDEENKELVRFWLTANGFSYGRTLDSMGNLTHRTNKEEDPSKSRRVEFRIITKSEEVVKRMIEMM